jgi:EAL domain-containing protein (putative c-di-GMP-specific phosphodiesterase class I)
MGEPFVSVNLGARVLDAAALGEHVEQRLAAEEVPARTLVVEVTEGSIADSRGVVATLEGLRRLGVRVAVDDFGAGYSSLARLRDLPLDLLEVDRAFLAAPFDRGEAILRAIVALAKGLDLPTVAEGVETAEQLALLRRVGISCAQGYLLARPMAAAEVLSWARTWGEGRLRDPALDLLRRAGR